MGQHLLESLLQEVNYAIHLDARWRVLSDRRDPHNLSDLVAALELEREESIPFTEREREILTQGGRILKEGRYPGSIEADSSTLMQRYIEIVAEGVRRDALFLESGSLPGKANIGALEEWRGLYSDALIGAVEKIITALERMVQQRLESSSQRR